MELASATTVATSSLNRMGTKSKNTGKGKDDHVDVVETNQPSETASPMSAMESGDAGENMNTVRNEAEAWRLKHSRYAQNTTEMISGSLLHDHADEHNFLMNRRSRSRRKISLEYKLTIMSSRSCFHDPWANIGRSFVTNTMRSRRP